jgi:general secretion pathway protein F
MPLFQYKAVTPAGEVLEGAMDSATQKGVIERLRDMGYTAIRAVQAGAAEAATWRRRAARFARGVSQDEWRCHAGIAPAPWAGLPSTAA